MTYERFKRVDFTPQIGTKEYTVLSKLPNRTQGYGEESSLYSVHSVQNNVWFVLMCLMFGIFLIYRLTRDIGPKRRFQQKPGSRVWEYFFALLVALILQGCLDTKRICSFGHRLMYISWVCGVLIFVNVFCAMSISRLSVSGHEGRIDYITDIIKYPKLRPSVGKTTAIYSFIETSPDPKFKALLKQIKRYKGEQRRAIEGVLKGATVMIQGRDYLKEILYQNCEKDRGLYLAKKDVFSGNNAVLLRKSLPYRTKQILSERTAMYFESGLFEHDMENLNFSTRCGSHSFKREGQEWAPFRFHEVAPAFQILLIGVTLAVAILLIECRAMTNHEAVN